jgi:predicted  nucleic acid-binding Zn-ribbon protein
VANSGSGRSARKTAKPRKTVAKPARSAAAELERLAAEKEASDDRVFSLTHRVATLEGRERDLNELIIGHRERIAALQAERDALGGQLEGEKGRSDRHEERADELDQQLAGARDRIAALEATRDELNQSQTVTLHKQVARLEAEGEMLNRALREERTAHAAIQQKEGSLRPELESARERIRALESEQQEVREGAERREQELLGRVAGAQEQIERVKSHRETLERALVKEQGSRAKLHEREIELADTRQRVTALEAERDKLASELEGERRGLAELRTREEELQRNLAQVRERESELQRDFTELGARERELQGTINGMREQVSGLEAQRTSLLAELDHLTTERERVTDRLERLEDSRTYRMMRFTWRIRKRIRHPFRRAPRPALSEPAKARKRKKPAELETAASPAPAPAAASDDRPKVKPMPAPAMRKPSMPVTAAIPAKAEPAQPGTPEKAPEGDRAAEPAPEPAEALEPAKAPEPEKVPAPEKAAVPVPAAAVVVDEIDAERERWLAKPQAPPADVSKLRVAGVLDEMSAACFRPDCELLRIDSEGWAEALETHEPHLLLVESAWQGNNGSWQYMVASYTHPDYIGLPNLRALIAACRERDIPTVFWNKEDPVHFERFKEAAALFDYVFTSDSNCIDRYAALEREGTGPIAALQFAAQPRIHNPIGAPGERNPSPVFAGAYYRDRHIDRQTSLQMLLDAAMPFGLQIYDRRFGHEDKAFGFPERFQDRVKGALPYDEMIEAYKAHRSFLNVNSVHDSPTMFSRRVFELLACGTAVVSTESIGVEQTLGEVVSVVETSDEATRALTKLQDDPYWRELTQNGRRKVIGEHTYRDRLAEVASALGFNVTAYPGEEVAALALVDDVEQARRFRAVVSSISAQETRPAELLIGSHTSVVGDLQELQADGSEIRVRVVQQDPEASRSQRYRELAALAASPWLAILHPAHTYGEHHLTDLVLTTRFADADVIGNASFDTNDGGGAIDRSLEHRFVDSVHPHSVLVRRELVERRGWPDDVGGAGGSLSDWFRHGVRIYSGDAGNFEADAALGLPGRAAATGSERTPDG